MTQGDASFEFGNYAEKHFEGALNIPIGDKLALRLSTQIVDRNGYTTEGGGDDVHQSGRAKLLWQPDDNLSVLLNASIGHVGGRGAAYVLLNHNVQGWSPLLDITDPRVATLYNNAPLNSAFGAGTVTQPPSTSQFLDLDFYNISAEVRYTAGPIVLTVEPAYRRAQMYYSFPAPFLNNFGGAFGDQPAKPETSDQTSLEVRIEMQIHGV